MEIAFILLFFVVLGILAYQSASASVYTIGLAVYFSLYTYFSQLLVFKIIFWLGFSLFVGVCFLRPLRRRWITSWIFKTYKKLMPSMSETEREALCAGDVGWVSEIFSGRPNWSKLKEMPFSHLSPEEQEFLDGPVETLCSLIDNWEISRSLEIPAEVLNYIKEQRFFSMIIPKSYGGLEFSAVAQSTVLSKIGAHSNAIATVVAVPNSLGPGELLLHYGTDQQKKHYLPRLAKSEEIPCFALTSPTAGSDAASIIDRGVVCQMEFDGKEQLCIRLNWDKRYITLAPIATLLGLAFKLYDPDQLLGTKGYIGITCALIPTTTPNVTIGRRHLPVGSAFPNGPTQGRDVIIPMDWIIGGVRMAGKGWKMLMSCLAAGRGISLPSVSGGTMAKLLLTSSAYARIRTQFNAPIGHFGGVQEALVQVVGYAYLVQSLRLFTASHIDEGVSPIVETAITKYNATEYARKAMSAAMDLHGGKGICMGPTNYITQSYFETPVAITVEGANILTRSMITFGQGAIRCHPYVLEELFAAQDDDSSAGLLKFDKAFWSHVGFVFSNHVRSFFIGLTNGYFVRVPNYGPLKRYYQLATRFSSILALIADVAMVSVGSALKRNEYLSGRLADMVSSIYMVTSVLKYYESIPTDNRCELDEWIAKWVCLDLFKLFERQLHELLINFPNRWVARYLRVYTMPWGRFLNSSTDNLLNKITLAMLDKNQVRERFKLYVAGYGQDGSILSKMEKVFEMTLSMAPLEGRVRNAAKKSLISGRDYMELLSSAVEKGVISKNEKHLLEELEKVRMDVINVDDFSDQDLVRK
jgi:acyl-CoA dehydrogenase